MSINICDLCYEITVPACQEEYEIPTGLSHQHTCEMVLEDINGNMYTQEGTPAQGGAWTITTGDFPEGMFNEWSGSYFIHFTENGIDSQHELEIDDTIYYCIKMNFVPATSLPAQ